MLTSKPTWVVSAGSESLMAEVQVCSKSCTKAGVLNTGTWGAVSRDVTFIVFVPTSPGSIAMLRIAFLGA